MDDPLGHHSYVAEFLNDIRGYRYVVGPTISLVADTLSHAPSSTLEASLAAVIETSEKEPPRHWPPQPPSTAPSLSRVL
jgi:hypothetical protein